MAVEGNPVSKGHVPSPRPEFLLMKWVVNWAMDHVSWIQPAWTKVIRARRVRVRVRVKELRRAMLIE